LKGRKSVKNISAMVDPKYLTIIGKRWLSLLAGILQTPDEVEGVPKKGGY